METREAEEVFRSTELLNQATSQAFREAAARIADDAIVTPLLRFDTGAGDTEIWLKPECLQPLGSFKIRAAANLTAMRSSELHGKIATASAGNFAQGLAFAAKRRGCGLSVHVPDNASPAKVEALKRLGVHLHLHSFENWWHIMATRNTSLDDGMFVHPVCEPEVIIGNGTIGLEIFDQRPDVDTVFVPYGGGGLVSGVALALRALGSSARIVAVEVETSSPLRVARDAGRPLTVDRRPSFVDGIGSVRVIDAMWPLVDALVDDVVVVSLLEIEEAMRRAAVSNSLVLEGAGGAALAAAMSGRVAGKKVACILSGGNISASEFARVMGAG